MKKNKINKKQRNENRENTKRKTHSEKTFLVGSEPIHRMRLMIYFIFFFFIENIGTFLDFSFCFFLIVFFSLPFPLIPLSRVVSPFSVSHVIHFFGRFFLCVFCSFSFYCCLFLFVIFWGALFSPLLLLLLIPILFRRLRLFSFSFAVFIL